MSNKKARSEGSKGPGTRPVRHTPGPWEVVDDTEDPDVTRCVKGSHGEYVCVPLIQDANLIAAAPCLLEALQSVLGWYEDSDIAYAMTKKGEQAEYHRTLRDARSAIAKAERGAS